MVAESRPGREINEPLPGNNRHVIDNDWYYVNEDTARQDLQLHARQIDHLLPFWFGITEEGGLNSDVDREAERNAEEAGLPILAIIHNYSSREYGPLVHRVLTNEAIRRNLIRNIVRLVRMKRYLGVNIDFQFVPPRDRADLTAFMRELYEALTPLGRKVTISVPAELEDNPQHPFSGAFSYRDLARYSDYLYVLAYDEHFATPGPVASIGFVRRVMDFAETQVPAAKLKLGIPVYGYDWVPPGGFPFTLSFAEAIETAQAHGATIVYDEEAQEPHFTYTADGVEHIVWFEDVRSFLVKLEEVLKRLWRGTGVWRLGQEDPRVWAIVGALQEPQASPASNHHA
ncbi:MAG TPA: glycoside hydrolase [Firmicutes bacterium]|nr:glycoside hydrolase [Candidatus Fermentithermobacillaceae bacterium]